MKVHDRHRHTSLECQGLTKFDTMQQQNKELLERQSKIVVSEEAGSEFDPDAVRYRDMQAAKKSPLLTPKEVQRTVDPGRKEPEEPVEFEAATMNVAEPSSTDVFSPPDEAMLQMKSPDLDMFEGEVGMNIGDTSREILAATLLGEAGTQGREGMGAVMSTIRSRQSTLASRGEKYSRNIY